MEEDLGKSETLAGSVWPLLVESGSALSNEPVREFVAHFIGLMHFRNISLFNMTLSGVTLARRLYGVPEPGAADQRIDINDTENFAKDVFIRSIRRGVDRMTERLLKMRWAILRIPSRTLATNDSPILFYRDSKLVLGPWSPNTTIFFPLSADRLLYLDDLTSHPGNVCRDSPPDLVALINMLLQRTAQRIVVGAHPPHEMPTLSSPN